MNNDYHNDYYKVKKYAGNIGTIIGEDRIKYLITENNLQIKEGDYVIFEKELYNDIEYTKWIARFIKKINKE